MTSDDSELSQPVVPQPVLQRMVEAAYALQAMQPWEWMREDDTFGLVDPATGQLHVALILGEREGPPGFGLYRGPRGVRYLFRDKDDPGTPLNPDLAMNEDSLVVEFTSRKDLLPHDIALLEASGVAQPKAKGKRKAAGLPRFDSRLPAHMPWGLDTAECELMTTALVLAQAFVTLIDEDENFYGDRPYEQIPVYSRVGDRPDSPWKLDWVTLEIAVQPGPPPADVPTALVEEAQRVPQDEQRSWELETYFPPTLIQKPKRPFFPRACIIADAENGRFLDVELAHPEDSEGNHAARSLLETIKEVGARPYSLWISSPVLMEALWPLAEQLSIRMRFRSLLRQTGPIKDYLAQRFRKEDASAEGSG